MRRRVFCLVITIFLSLPFLAEGQCRKRILVYLDVSGSMRPKVNSGEREGSPYHQTLSALESLFQQAGFIEAGDTVRVVRFGRQVMQVDSAEGPGGVAGLIQALRNNRFDEKETDFRAAFGDLAEELPVGVYDRQVVLFASDLAHEPRDGMPSAEAIADWQAALTQARAELEGKFEAHNAIVVVSQPAASGVARQETARQVLADLRLSFPVAAVVPSGTRTATGAQDLAQMLRQGLLSPLRMQVSRDSEDADRLVFEITNDNCIPLHLRRLTVKPEGGGAVFFEDLSEQEREIGARQTKQRTREIRRSLPPGEEWKDARLSASAETDEGVGGTSEGTTASWIRCMAATAVFERRPLLANVLRLDLDLMGFTDPASITTYRLTLGDDTRPLAQAEFVAPALSSTRARSYRIVLPLRGATDETGNVRVALEGGEVLQEEDVRAGLSEDAHASHHHRVFASLTILALLGVAGGFLWVRHGLSGYRIFAFSRWDWLRWAGALGVVLLLIGLFKARIPLLNLWPAATADQWLGWLACFCVLVLTAFLLREVLRTLFVRAVVGPKALQVRSYLRRGKLSFWLPLGAGLLACILLASAFWPLRPVGSPDSRRSEAEAHPRLHVTSHQR